MYTSRLETVGDVVSFVKSFTASARGWGIPAHPTLLGPLRIWIYPNTFRSSKVKKATPTNTKITKIKFITIDANVS
jgi:hypothetical protein